MNEINKLEEEIRRVKSEMRMPEADWLELEDVALISASALGTAMITALTVYIRKKL